MSSPGALRRYIVFDAVRGMAVLLAMIDHVKVQFVPDVHVFVPLTRLATPCFIILFGTMIELAYLSKVRSGASVQQARQRMTARMLDCIAIFAALTAAAMVSGNLGLSRGVQALFGFGPGRFSEILFIYALLFATVLLLLPLILRYGASLILALSAFGWLLKTGVESAGYVEVPYVVTFFTGIGEGYGPALLPAMTFLGFGVALGEAMTSRRNRLVPVMLLLAAGLICAFELSGGVTDAGRRFLAHRWTNHPGYFAVGIMGFAGLSLCLLAAQRIPYTRRLPAVLASIGRQSLFVYAGGNLALNLLPMFEIARLPGTVLAVLFLTALVGLALLRADGRKASATSRALRPDLRTPGRT